MGESAFHKDEPVYLKVRRPRVAFLACGTPSSSRTADRNGVNGLKTGILALTLNFGVDGSEDTELSGSELQSSLWYYASCSYCQSIGSIELASLRQEQGRAWRCIFIIFKKKI